MDEHAQSSANTYWPELEQSASYLNAADLSRLQEALAFAAHAHRAQKRSSGEPYITHPLAVAQLCTRWRLDVDGLCAALLHDTVEDTGISLEQLKTQFGSKVAELVDGLTKIDKLSFSSRQRAQAENFRKMLLAMVRDLRVILIKLADRLHNIRTLEGLAVSKQKRVAQETIEVFAPIAQRLGLVQITRELEDLCFAVLQPFRYRVLTRALAAAGKQRKELVAQVMKQTQTALQAARIDAEIHGREKSLYSIYRKMRDKHMSFALVSDIFGFRIMVHDRLQCYTVLGILHSLYKPVVGKLKDYIAIPKINGYQSLHTTVNGPSALPLEFQIRTFEMDAVAERGIASHWAYKAQNGSMQAELPNVGNTGWLQSLLDIQSTSNDAEEFLDHVKFDLEPQAVYVLTPQSKVISLPRGATAVDFAYAVHSDLGHCAVAVKINHELAPLRAELHNGDLVEIITSSVSLPNPEWLGFVKTARAKAAIRHSLRTSRNTDAIVLGQRLLRRAIRQEGLANDSITADMWQDLAEWAGAKNQAELEADVGMGRRSAGLLAKHLLTTTRPEQRFMQNAAQLFESSHTDQEEFIELNGREGLPVQYAPCCLPLPGDEVMGFIGQGEGLIVHRQGCTQLRKLSRFGADHFLKLTWASELDSLFATAIDIKHENRRGVLAKIASCISQNEADIANIEIEETPQLQTTVTRYHLQLRNLQQLQKTLNALNRLEPVQSAERVQYRAHPKQQRKVVL